MPRESFWRKSETLPAVHSMTYLMLKFSSRYLVYWLLSTESFSGSVVSTGSTCWPKVISTTSSNFLNARSSVLPGSASSATSVESSHSLPAASPPFSSVAPSVEAELSPDAELPSVVVEPLFPQAARPAVIASARSAAIILLLIGISPLKMLARSGAHFF